MSKDRHRLSYRLFKIREQESNQCGTTWPADRSAAPWCLSSSSGGRSAASYRECVGRAEGRPGPPRRPRLIKTSSIDNNVPRNHRCRSARGLVANVSSGDLLQRAVAGAEDVPDAGVRAEDGDVGCAFPVVVADHRSIPARRAAPDGPDGLTWGETRTIGRSTAGRRRRRSRWEPRRPQLSRPNPQRC